MAVCAEPKKLYYKPRTNDVKVLSTSTVMTAGLSRSSLLKLKGPLAMLQMSLSTNFQDEIRKKHVEYICLVRGIYHQDKVQSGKLFKCLATRK